jgi:hypothetical protein
MARKFVVSLDLNKNELLNARVQNLATAPSNPVSGQIYYDTVTGIMYFYNGTEWVPTSGSAEVIQDTVATMIVDGTGLDKSYDDNAGTLTLSIDSTVTTNDGVQTLTNKTLTSPTVSGLYLSDSAITFEGSTSNNFETTLEVVNPSADRTLTLPDATDTLIGKNTTDTLTNKTIDLTSNTLTGTVSEFNTALEGDNFVTLTGTETLTNKTLTSPTVSGLYLSDQSIVFEGVTSNEFETTLSAEDPTADRTLALPNKTGTIAITTDITSAIDALSTTDIEEGANLYYTDERVDDRVNGVLVAGTGITKTYNDEANSLTIAADTAVMATREYVNEVAQGLVAKPAVEAATTENLDATYDNGTLGVGATLTSTSNGALPAIDGHSDWSIGDGILIKNQTNAAHNGRYVVQILGDSENPWVLKRCGLCDQASEIPGMYIFVQDGTVNINTGWVATVVDAATFVVGTDAINFYQFSGAGTYTAGNGLTLTGTTFDVGAGIGIVSNANDVAIDTTVVARKYAVNVGDNTLTSFTVTHNLGTKDVIVQVYENGSPYSQVEADIEHSTTSAVVVKFATAPTTDQYRVSVVG